MRKRTSLWLLAVCAISLGFSRAKTTELCPGITIENDAGGGIEPELTGAEKRLVCGEEVPDKAGSAWAQIPFTQMQYNMKNFLQQRGYHHPAFVRGKEAPSGSTPSVIILGNLTRVRRMALLPSTLRNELPSLDPSRKRRVIGEPLTPKLLNEVERWVSEQLQEMGYGCPEVVARAFPDEGAIEIEANPGEKVTFGDVEQETLPGLHDDLLRRYDSFEKGKPFQSRLLTVTSNRVKSEGVVEYAHLSHSCSRGQADMKQKVFAGQPVLLTVGAGANTEGALLGKVTWKNTRVGTMGSQVGLTLFGSSRLQTLQGNHLWYFLPDVSRSLLNSSFELTHREEAPYAILLARTQTSFERRFDVGSLGGAASVGPAITVLKTLRGFGTPESQIGSLDARLSIKSHDFEYYLSNPQSGVKLELEVSVTDRNLVSSVTAQRVSLSMESLWNIHAFDPPLFILGTRGAVYSTLTAQDATSMSLLPPTFRYFLGGSTNLRGFGRQSLAGRGAAGALTAAFIGVELRLSHTLPYSLDPFIFTDLGTLGSGVGSLESPLYTSPGLGVRWGSPIGSIRATVARGYADGAGQYLQFYVGLGEEF